jgi:hypothetical protein
MNPFLRLKHWQVFLMLTTGFILHNFRIQENPLLTSFFCIVGAIIYFSWIPIMVYELSKRLNERITLNYALFIFTSCLWLTVHLTMTLMQIYRSGKLPFFQLGIFLIFFPAIHYFIFPARLLKSIEINAKAKVVDCLWYFLLLVNLPIGIWLLQPRINKQINSV